jgi:hypothetical protein
MGIPPQDLAAVFGAVHDNGVTPVAPLPGEQRFVAPEVQIRAEQAFA